MRYFLAILTTLSAFALSACGGSDDGASTDSDRLPEPTASLTETTIQCAEFDGTAERIAEAQKQLYSSEGPADAIAALVAELEALKAGAPADVQAALDTISKGFRDAAALGPTPDAEDQAKLADVAAELSAAGQKVAAYFVEQCR